MTFGWSKQNTETKDEEQRMKEKGASLVNPKAGESLRVELQLDYVTGGTKLNRNCC